MLGPQIGIAPATGLSNKNRSGDGTSEHEDPPIVVAMENKILTLPLRTYIHHHIYMIIMLIRITLKMALVTFMDYFPTQNFMYIGEISKPRLVIGWQMERDFSMNQ